MGGQQDLPRSLPRLTGLRAFAALGVFVFHLGKHGVLMVPGSRVGFTGVSFFFVLSGFVLVWAAKPRSGILGFYRRRLARIYPLHFVMLIAAVFVPVVQVARSWKIAIPNALLLQAWFPDIYTRVVYGMNGDSWSLSCELLFYAVFPLLLVILTRSSRLGRWLFAGGYWAVASIGVLMFHRAEVYSFPPIRLGEFLLGMAAALEIRGGWRPRLPVTAAVSLICILTGMSYFTPFKDPDVVIAPGFLVLVLAVSLADLRPVRGLLGHPWFVYAGEVSFAFYLVHELAMVNVQYLVHVSGALQAGITLILSVGGAVTLHHVVERPMHTLITGRRRTIGPLAQTSQHL